MAGSKKGVFSILGPKSTRYDPGAFPGLGNAGYSFTACLAAVKHLSGTRRIVGRRYVRRYLKNSTGNLECFTGRLCIGLISQLLQNINLFFKQLSCEREYFDHNCACVGQYIAA